MVLAALPEWGALFSCSEDVAGRRLFFFRALKTLPGAGEGRSGFARYGLGCAKATRFSPLNRCVRELARMDSHWLSINPGSNSHALASPI